jgi:hypothetical protein|tara:strand:- start:113 stop:505 length:393 start_codon:yes stop_codon:yes gene_type:complete
MIEINGGTLNQRKYAFSIAVYVCQKFNITPTIEINFKCMANDSAVGNCMEVDHGEYEVNIKRTLRMRDMLTTLAHEIVHVKQYFNNEFKDESHIDYWDRESEVEAHGRETGLFIRWCEKEQLSHHKWAQV